MGQRPFPHLNGSVGLRHGLSETRAAQRLDDQRL